MSVGTPDGQIYLCEVGGYEPYTVRTLDDIAAAIEASPHGNAGKTAHELGQLGGDPARVETIDERRGGGPPSYHFVYAFRDGRPVVLMFDYWTLALELISDEQLEEMLRSFEVLGAAPARDTTDADADAVRD